MLRTTALAFAATTAFTSLAWAEHHTLDIVDTAVANGNFTTLVAAVEAAGLVETLKGEGPFTVFAPTDEAFAALPAGTVEGLLADIPTLTGILTYHVVPGDVRAGDLSEGLTAATVNGQELTFTLESGAQVNGVNIVIADIATTNGVIHVIDAVLMPE
ncbi:MAG: fasciclin domain-containing protein [Pararhodobacter sp.]